MKPTFIGIGGQKCASTWLSECMRYHPQIYVSSPKELRYFTENYCNGLDWYLNYFRQSVNFIHCGEFSSNYIYSPAVAKAIKEEIGQVKIIAVIREPVSRTLSHFKHLVRIGVILEPRTRVGLKQFQDYVQDNPKLVTNSRYAAGLDEYLKVFGQDNMFVVDQADCLAKPDVVLASLWKYLDVECVNVTSARRRVGLGINPRFKSFERVRRAIFRLAKSSSPGLIDFMRRSGLSSLYRKINQGNEIAFEDEVRDYIRGLCNDDWSYCRTMFITQAATEAEL